MKPTPVILVTGASRGLGRGIALNCARAGYSIAIHYAGNEAAAKETMTQCRAVATDAAQQFVPVRGNFPYSTGNVIHVDGGFHLRKL